MARYGLPYKGSKSRIADWVVGLLPASDVLVDLMAGGCAVTHAALLSGKWKCVVANDVCEGPEVFQAAINGEFAGYSTVPTRDEFKQSDDFVLRLLYSFGNNRRDYLWSRELEPVKVAASRMIVAPSEWERRAAYKVFCNALAAYLKGGDAVVKLTGSVDGHDKSHGLQGLQGLQGLERLQGLQGLERLQVSRLDYRDVTVPEGATVYCDPPYRGVSVEAYGEAGTSFDFDAFDQWLADVPFPVYVSEYTCPPGCVEIASTHRHSTAGTGNKGGNSTERLFIQERFYNANVTGS